MTEFNPDKHYYGKPCKHGHIGIRYKKHGSCVECVSEQGRKYRRDNPNYYRALDRRRYQERREGAKERARLWREANPERHKDQIRQWRAQYPEAARKQQRSRRLRNLERFREHARRYVANHPEKSRESCARRRARKAKATPAWIDHEEVKYIYSLATEKGLVVDHIVPLKSDSVCGLHCAENLRCIPEQLNSHKGNRYWPDMPDEGS